MPTPSNIHWYTLYGIVYEHRRQLIGEYWKMAFIHQRRVETPGSHVLLRLGETINAILR